MDWVEVKWPLPSGLVERFARLPLDRYITLEEGTGKTGNLAILHISVSLAQFSQVLLGNHPSKTWVEM